MEVISGPCLSVDITSLSKGTRGLVAALLVIGLAEKCGLRGVAVKGFVNFSPHFLV